MAVQFFKIYMADEPERKGLAVVAGLAPGFVR